METERLTIIELYRKGKDQSEILKILNIPKTRRKFVYRTINRYKDTGSVSDKPKSGRPASVTTTRMRKIVRGRVWRNLSRSVRKMAAELKVSRSSLQRIVKRDLGLSSFKKRKVHYLSKVMKEKRPKRSKGLIDRFAIQGLDHVLFSDEKLFTIEEAYNQQNDRILSSTASTIPEVYRYVKRVQKPCSVMVWAGISSLSRTPIVSSQLVKINAQTYQNLVLKPIVQDLSKSMFNNEPFLFQQDGAPAHTAKTTQSWLHSEIPDFISKQEWPPSSPDLNPLDLSVWSILQTKACCKSHKNLEALKRSIIRAWSEIPQETMRMAVEAVPSRLRAVIKKKGGYIE